MCAMFFGGTQKGLWVMGVICGLTRMYRVEGLGLRARTAEISALHLAGRTALRSVVNFMFPPSCRPIMQPCFLPYILALTIEDCLSRSSSVVQQRSEHDRTRRARE